jgi:hypothetical protein
MYSPRYFHHPFRCLTGIHGVTQYYHLVSRPKPANFDQIQEMRGSNTSICTRSLATKPAQSFMRLEDIID